MSIGVFSKNKRNNCFKLIFYFLNETFLRFKTFKKIKNQENIYKENFYKTFKYIIIGKLIIFIY